jgi:hypothetical protein
MKYIITWNAGFGGESEVVEADSIGRARVEAYDRWLEAAENEALYKAEEYSDELAEELGIDG